MGLPETGLPYMLGIWGSAFCATLAHYYKEVRPLIKSLAGFEGFDDLMEDRNADLIKLHPVAPGAIPNFALGLEDHLASSCPETVFKDQYLELMDAGMSNNLPIYPLLRQGRDVDIIVCFDASAKTKEENWLSVVDGYAKERNVRSWPFGAGWPHADDETKKEIDAADAITAQEAASKIDAEKEQHAGGSDSQSAPPDAKQMSSQDESDLGYCNVWVGTNAHHTFEKGLPSSRRITSGSDSALSDPDAGIAVVYFPFLKNPAVEGVDPDTSPYLSTWNFIYTPEEIDKVVALARANFNAGEELTKRTVREVYERKKARRLAIWEEERIRRWKRRVRDGGDHFR